MYGEVDHVGIFLIAVLGFVVRDMIDLIRCLGFGGFRQSNFISIFSQIHVVFF
jgi:hypothetical protein